MPCNTVNQLGGQQEIGTGEKILMTINPDQLTSNLTVDEGGDRDTSYVPQPKRSRTNTQDEMNNNSNDITEPMDLNANTFVMDLTEECGMMPKSMRELYEKATPEMQLMMQYQGR